MLDVAQRYVPILAGIPLPTQETGLPAFTHGFAVSLTLAKLSPRQYKQPRPHLVSNEPITREPRPIVGLFDLLDPLLGRAQPVVEVG